MAPWVPLPAPAGPGMRAILESPSAVRALLRAHGTRTPDVTLRQIIKIGCSRPDRIPPEVLAAALKIARERALLSHAEDGFAPAVSSLMEFTRSADTLPASLESIRASTLVMQGTEDRVVPPSVIQRLRLSRPDWTYHMLDGVGHVPQFEVPIQVADTIVDWAHNGYVPQPSAT
jgi:pimeloyl-ACP methyl ester carboxylesterase